MNARVAGLAARWPRAAPILLATIVLSVSLALAAEPVHDDAHTARVSYLAGGTVYVSAGRAEGLREGDTLEVWRAGRRVARLRAVYLSTHRAACDTFAVTAEIRAEDEVLYRAAVGASPDTAGTALPDVRSATPSETAIAAVAPDTTRASRSDAAASRVRGRVGASFFSAGGVGSAGRLRQPAADLRLDANRLAASRLDVSADVRGRRTDRGGTESASRARVYRLWASLHDIAGRHRLTIGRQSSPSLSGISLFDGVLVERRGARFGAGLFAGSQPRPLALEFSTEIVEGGGYVEWRAPAGEARRWTLTTGIVASRAEGSVNRDFAFLQAAVIDPRWSGFLFHELDANLGWKRDLEDAPVSLTSTFATVRARVAARVSVFAGLDHRRNVRLHRDRVTPETEFDDRSRRGAWAGMSLEPAPRLRLDTEARTGERDGDRAHTLSAGASWGPLGRHRLAMRARGSSFRSERTSSALVAGSLGAEPIAALHVEIGGGTRVTEDRETGARERSPWTGIDADVTLFAGLYAFGSLEWDRSDGEDQSSTYTGLSYRF